jgi:hypothetical protein
MKNDHEVGSLRGSRRKERDQRYVPIGYDRKLYEEERPVPWTNVNLPGGWLLNSRWVPSRGTTRSTAADFSSLPIYEIHRHFGV